MRWLKIEWISCSTYTTGTTGTTRASTSEDETGFDLLERNKLWGSAILSRRRWSSPSIFLVVVVVVLSRTHTCARECVCRGVVYSRLLHGKGGLMYHE